jgi:hypothetical protein
LALSRSTLRKFLRYNPKTGEFTWKVARPRTPAGSVAGYKRAGGYTSIKLGDVEYKAHRLAFLYMTGKWPKEEIDHIDNKKGNNRWANLRAASHHQNLMNMPVHKDNPSGRKGVSWDSWTKLWRARIMFNGKAIDLGRYTGIDEASKAYEKAARKLFGEFARF